MFRRKCLSLGDWLKAVKAVLTHMTVGVFSFVNEPNTLS